MIECRSPPAVQKLWPFPGHTTGPAPASPVPRRLDAPIRHSTARRDRGRSPRVAPSDDTAREGAGRRGRPRAPAAVARPADGRRAGGPRWLVGLAAEAEHRPDRAAAAIVRERQGTREAQEQLRRYRLRRGGRLRRRAGTVAALCRGDGAEVRGAARRSVRRVSAGQLLLRGARPLLPVAGRPRRGRGRIRAPRSTNAARRTRCTSSSTTSRSRRSTFRTSNANTAASPRAVCPGGTRPSIWIGARG